MHWIPLCLLAAGGLIDGVFSKRVNADFLLKRMANESYDARERPPSADPNDENGPVNIDVNILIRSLSNVDSVSMSYDVQINLRQEWKDSRLAYDATKGDHVVLTDRDAIWRPDTFFKNEMRAHRHEIDTPNLLMRIFPDGTVLFSERLTLTLSCPMYLAMFPMDVQKCDLDVASYAYTTEDIVYKWMPHHQLQLMIDVDSALPSFHLDGYESSMCTSKTNTGEYSCLRATLTLSRQFNYYVMQLYTPSAMLVIVSWVSFWLDSEAAAARVTLGVIALLMITIQSAVINMKLPPVSYVKVIDVWIGTCLAFIFAALIEYAYVNCVVTQDKANTITRSSSTEKSSPIGSTEGDNLLANSVRGSDKGQKIDSVSRIAFPLAFLVFNIVYWTYCHMHSEQF